QHAPGQRRADQGAAFAVILGFLAVETPGQIALVMFGQRDRRGRRQRNAFIGRAEDHIELDATVDNGRRIETSQLGQGRAAVEQTGIEEIGAGAPGFQSELTKAQNPALDGEADELALIRLHEENSRKTLISLIARSLGYHTHTSFQGPFMRIISVNVNGIQAAAQRGLLSWLQAQNADVICLQDTRASVVELDDPAYQLDGYFLYACDAEIPEQGGVALYSRLQPKAIIMGLGFETADRYGRYLQADFDKVSISSLLLPTGRGGDEELNQKFKFMDDFAHYLDKQRRKRREYLYCGSLHVAHQKLDVKNWRDCQQEVGFLAPERAWLDEIFGTMGYVDALREVTREGDLYSWWSDTEQAQLLNLGWRFDYQILTSGLRRFVRSARLPRQPRFSQHSALIVDYDWTLSL